MTTNGTTPGPRQMSNQVLGEAAKRMLPVLAGRVLAAVADRAVEKVDGLADRLGESGAGGAGGAAGTKEEAPEGQSSAGAAVAFVMEQARLFLAFVVRLAAQALEMLRRATETLRARRAPEGIDEAPAPEEITAPEDLEDEYEDEYEDEDDEIEERATARA
ncbi:hypothetical protein [Actinomycetospora callitridis]|uniref:hypothetical protein n=1 Tax=Actinomycetospora callitridis TaxID=913944 RepID=UPI002365AB9A|nr:hypothetical protein [Actinomycetospora callitridis]MDD7920076.1 hypothetical protein [Actinomycetospora callitridis]